MPRSPPSPTAATSSRTSAGAASTWPPCEDADPAGPLGDEHPPVGREGHRPRDLEVLGDDLDGEARAVGRGDDIAGRRRRRIGRRRIVAGGASGDDDERER